jgi:two-component system cell cycle sensor histidine kinase/response regulator CckA
MFSVSRSSYIFWVPSIVRNDRVGEPPSATGGCQRLPVRETVLLVEDDEGIRLLARLALQPHGYFVLAAANGDQALEIGRQYLGAIHILITDIQVPGLRGPDLALRIASLRPGIKVLFISGGIAGHDRLPTRAALLDKPFSIEVLTRTVRKLLDS